LIFIFGFKVFGSVDGRVRGLLGRVCMEKRKVSMRPPVDGKMGADLADDDGVSRLTGLDDVDAQAFICRAIALADMRPDAVVRALVAYVVLLGVALYRIRGRVRGVVM
jgi:hypothetical protein